jgi:hypothetical protein
MSNSLLRPRVRTKLLMLFSLFQITLVSCFIASSDIREARRVVLDYLDAKANDPFGEGPTIKGLIHPDFTGLGPEGFEKSVIDRRVRIESIQKTIGDFNLANPHKENVIEVVVTARQTYYVKETRAKREEKKYTIRFILSKPNLDAGKYLILRMFRSSFADIVYEDALRSALQKRTSSWSGELRRSLIAAGMQGLKE